MNVYEAKVISEIQHKNSISNFFEKKKKKNGFPCCSRYSKIFPFMHQLATNVRLIQTKIG